MGKQIEVAGWGHQMRVAADVERPETVRALESSCHGQGIARGLGRSYGDAAIAPERVWMMTRLNRMLSFRNGVLTAEAGTSLGDILRVFLPRGYTLPVTPGTQWVTLGGAVAADVHGKNHHTAGTFSRYVEEITLCTADGEMRRIGPGRDPDLFWATVGGMGLTGLILEVSLRLQAIETGYISVDYFRTRDLEETLNWFSVHDASYPFTVAWLDCLASGRSLGRAVLMGGRPTERAELSGRQPAFPMPHRTLRMPFSLPSGMLSRSVGVAFNAAYYGVHRPGAQQIEPWWKFFYPLDVVDDWHRLYGRRGFAQYQAVFPAEVGAQELAALLGRIQNARHPNFLGVLKRMGPSSPGMLSFPRAGLTLALDLPMQGEGTSRLFRELYAQTADLGGRAYLAKDSFLTPDLLQRMYPRLSEFRAVKKRVDPAGRWRSALALRLGLAGGS